MAAAERLQRLHQWLGIAATMLATAAAASIVAVLSKIAAGMLALGTAIVSAVLTVMKPERAAEPRRRSPARHAASPRMPGP